MNLLFIYGPPASGKLTIANEISKYTGLPIFHNHLTRDLVGEIFPETLPENYQLVTDLRNNVFAYCAKNNHSVIFTWVYDGPEDDKSLMSMVDAVITNGGNILFVEITASIDDLIKRVSLDSRKKHKKLTDPEKLRQIMTKMSPSSIPFPDVLKLNSSDMSAQASARRIIEHFQIDK